MTDPTPDPAPTIPPVETPAGINTEPEPERFAVYDLTFLKFVGPVYGDKARARDELKTAAKAAGRDAKTYEIRSV